MPRHVTHYPRCPRCSLRVALCMCAHLTKLETRTRVVILMHAQEAEKTTNTGRIAHESLSRSELRVYANRAGPVPERPWDPSTQPALLFPTSGARPLESLRDGPPVTLLVPDGTWRQAARLRRRVGATGEVPFVAVPDGPGLLSKLRTGHRDGHLSTAEAIARALGVLEGPEAQAHLERALAIFMERVLWLRGALRDDEVTAGLPAGAWR